MHLAIYATCSLINALGTVLESAVFDTNITSPRLNVLRGKFDLMAKMQTAKWKKNYQQQPTCQLLLFQRSDVLHWRLILSLALAYAGIPL